MFPLLPSPNILNTAIYCDHTTNPLNGALVSSLCTASTSQRELIQLTFSTTSIPIVAPNIQIYLAFGVLQSILILFILLAIYYKK